jgi:hypothetical protein
MLNLIVDYYTTAVFRISIRGGKVLSRLWILVDKGSSEK